MSTYAGIGKRIWKNMCQAYAENNMDNFILNEILKSLSNYLRLQTIIIINVNRLSPDLKLRYCPLIRSCLPDAPRSI